MEVLPGFDVAAGSTWIYPSNMSHRKYQFDIVQSCLFNNTLVCLPTGLGKTFIAAVIMYNFYRFVVTAISLLLHYCTVKVVSEGQNCLHGAHQTSGGAADRGLLQGDGNPSVGHRGDDWGGGTEGESGGLEGEGEVLT